MPRTSSMSLSRIIVKCLPLTPSLALTTIILLDEGHNCNIWISTMEIHSKILQDDLNTLNRKAQLSKKSSFRQGTGNNIYNALILITSMSWLTVSSASILHSLVELQRLGIRYRWCNKAELSAIKLSNRINLQAPNSLLMLPKYAIRLLEFKNFPAYADSISRNVKKYQEETKEMLSAHPKQRKNDYWSLPSNDEHYDSEAQALMEEESEVTSTNTNIANGSAPRSEILNGFGGGFFGRSIFNSGSGTFNSHKLSERTKRKLARYNDDSMLRHVACSDVTEDDRMVLRSCKKRHNPSTSVLETPRKRQAKVINSPAYSVTSITTNSSQHSPISAIKFNLNSAGREFIDIGNEKSYATPPRLFDLLVYVTSSSSTSGNRYNPSPARSSREV
jgi:hypothetical protein